MPPLNFWKIFAVPFRRMSSESIVRRISRQKGEQPHVYRKIYTKEELIQFIEQNTVYRSCDYMVSAVPQGICFVPSRRWCDSSMPFSCEVPIAKVLPDLAEIYKSDTIIITKHPKRNASGVIIFATNLMAHKSALRNFSCARLNLEMSYTYLAVVMGAPELMEKTFIVNKFVRQDQYLVEVMEKARGSVVLKDSEIARYRHRVLDSTEQVSLLEVTTSCDLRDCPRNVLAQISFTPVFGDFWSMERVVNFLFGVPQENDIFCRKPKPNEMVMDILKKLHLTADEQRLIPIHLHLYGVMLPVKGSGKLFVSVPPPDSFVWTCQRLGLHEVHKYTKPQTHHRNKKENIQPRSLWRES